MNAGDDHSSIGAHGRILVGETLAQVAREIGLTNADVETLAQGFDKAPAEPISFDAGDACAT